MSADPRVRVGVGVIVRRAGRLLMMRRAPGASHGEGCWSVPGGWVDHGETPAEAAVRELREETGIVGRDPYLVTVVANTYPEHGDMHVVCLFYAVTASTGEPVNAEPDKAAEVLWVPRTQVIEKTPHFAPFASLLDAGYLL